MMRDRERQISTGTLVHHPAVETGMFGDEVTLHDLRTDETHELNPSAAAVWLSMVGGRTAESIVDYLSARYGAPAGQVEADVREVVHQFEARGLLLGSPEPTAPPALTLTPTAADFEGRSVMPRPPDT